MGKLVNKAALEEFLGLSHTTLTEYQEQGLPILKRGSRGEEHEYDTAEVVKWLIQRELVRAGKGEKPSEREARLRGDVLELELAQKRDVLVPSTEVQPIWEGRVLAAAAYMRSRASHLAGELEATQGLEGKRALLRKSDAVFLNHLGVDGERMQVEVDALLEKQAAGDADAFLRRIAGHDHPSDSAAPPAGGVG
jgi:hypothetical protein